MKEMQILSAAEDKIQNAKSIICENLKNSMTITSNSTL
jgi:hypothetical protein